MFFFSVIGAIQMRYDDDDDDDNNKCIGRNFKGGGRIRHTFRKKKKSNLIGHLLKTK